MLSQAAMSGTSVQKTFLRKLSYIPSFETLAGKVVSESFANLVPGLNFFDPNGLLEVR